MKRIDVKVAAKSQEVANNLKFDRKLFFTLASEVFVVDPVKLPNRHSPDFHAPSPDRILRSYYHHFHSGRIAAGTDEVNASKNPVRT